MSAAAERTIWVVTDGKPGMENQCLGLAEALMAAGNPAPLVKRIVPRFPWTVLPPAFWWAPLFAPGPAGDALAPPWPDILIATGRQTVAPALAIKKASGGRTFCVQIQNPVTGRDRFDLLAIPAHDGVSGDNVIVTQGALHRVTAEKLASEAEKFAPALVHLPRPLVAVLIGGTNGQYTMTETVTRKLAADLAGLCRRHGAGLAVTASRRTGDANAAILRDSLSTCPAHVWDGNGDNPYFGFLGLADAIVVTADSVSMVSEACATGKPVYVVDLDGGSAKFARFHDGLRDAGITRAFDGSLENWRYDTPDDTARVAAEVMRRYDSA